MTTDRLTISANEIASQLGRSVRWFMANRRALEADHGMPKKLPGGANWSRSAVEIWMLTYGQGDAAKAMARQDLIARQQAALQSAYGGAA